MSAEFSRAKLVNWAQLPRMLPPEVGSVSGNVIKGSQRAELCVRLSGLIIDVCCGYRMGGHY